MRTRFKDRTAAGRELASRLSFLKDEDVVVLALPRGGLPVACEIAHALHAPLDVLNVRKLGVPWHEELAMGAIASGGVRVLNPHVIMALGVSEAQLEHATSLQRLELERRERAFRGGRPAPELRNKTVVLVDDGIATGATVRAAIAVIKSLQPAKLVLAVPVAQASIAEEIAREVDQLICVSTPGDLFAIGVWYDDFAQLGDEDVRAILAKAAAEPWGTVPAPAGA